MQKNGQILRTSFIDGPYNTPPPQVRTYFMDDPLVRSDRPRAEYLSYIVTSELTSKSKLFIS